MSDKCEDRIDKHLEGRLADMRGYSRLQEMIVEYDLDVDNIIEWGEFDVDNFPEVEDEDDLKELEQLVTDLYQGNIKTPDQFADSALSVDKTTTYRVCMSYGGPADYFDVKVDSDGEIFAIDYVFQDWFDGATRPLTGHDFEVAKDYLSTVFCFEEM